jgi:MFS transporter, PPP family, 3-phenylpropionic acid transporter
MRDVRVQYFLSYGVLGTVLPFASVYFRANHFSEAQVGYAWALYSAAYIVSPVLVTLLADTRADPRRLMLGGFVLGGLTLVAMGLVHAAAAVLAVWGLFCLAYLPLLPLQDGIAFSLQRRRQERGEPPLPFHRARVWGTVGYIVPSFVLFILLWSGRPVTGVMMSGAAFAAVAAAQALLLDDPRAHAPLVGAHDGVATRLPTVGALKVLLRPQLLGFSTAIFLSTMASVIYGSFYPIYLTESAGFAPRWVALISSIGVLVEVFFVAGCGWLTTRLGVKPLLVLGLVLVALRLVLLAASAHPFVAVGTQLFHGIMVVALGVMPQAFVNGHATDRYRHSMQGVFVMLLGCARVAGSLAGGRVAAAFAPHGLPAAFAFAAALCAAAAVIALAFFKVPTARAAAQERPSESSVAAATAGS